MRKLYIIWNSRPRLRNGILVCVFLAILSAAIAIPMMRQIHSGRDILGCRKVDFHYPLKNGILYIHRCPSPASYTRFVIDTGNHNEGDMDIFTQEDTNNNPLFHKYKACTITITIRFKGKPAFDKDLTVKAIESC